MKLSQSQRENLTRTAELYNQQVHHAATFLETRGLHDEEVLDSYLLGYVEEPAPGHETYQGRLCIPYITPSGVVNLRFRRLGEAKWDGEPKYMGLANVPVNLYNVAALRSAGDVIYMTEGELDAISATVVGFPAVGVPGVQSWKMRAPRDEEEAAKSKRHWLRLLEDFEEVVVLADGDDPGREFADRVAGDVERVRVVHMPRNEDVNSVLVGQGVESFRQLVGRS